MYQLHGCHKCWLMCNMVSTTASQQEAPGFDSMSCAFLHRLHFLNVPLFASTVILIGDSTGNHESVNYIHLHMWSFDGGPYKDKAVEWKMCIRSGDTWTENPNIKNSTTCMSVYGQTENNPWLNEWEKSYDVEASKAGSQLAFTMWMTSNTTIFSLCVNVVAQTEFVVCVVKQLREAWSKEQS